MRLRRIYLALGALIAAGVVGLGSWADVDPPERRFAAYVAAMRAAGEPTSYGEIGEIRVRRPLDSESAAVEIEHALDWVDSALGSETDWPKAAWFLSVDGVTPPEDRAPAERFAERLRPFAERVKAALDRPTCQFSRHERLDRVGVLFRTLARFARNSSEQMDACRTWGLFAARLDPSRQWTPWDYAEFTLACESELKLAVESGRWEAVEVRTRLDETLSLLVKRQRENMDCNLIFSRTGAIAAHQQRFDYAQRAGVVERVRRTLLDRRDWDDDADLVLAEAECLRALRRLPDLTFAAYRKAWLDVRKPEAELSVQMMAPDRSQASFMEVTRHWAAVSAFANLARIALAAAEHRAKNGDFPASLDDLRWAFPDAVPLDTFTDAPFVYEPTSAGVRIKSRGIFADQKPGPNTGSEIVWDLRR